MSLGGLIKSMIGSVATNLTGTAHLAATSRQWNVVLQAQTQNGASCHRLSVGGLPRPCRILFVPCDPAADWPAHASHQALHAQIGAKSRSSDPCGGPIHPGCMAETEPACEHILVAVIAQAPISSSCQQMLSDWASRPGRRLILPALAPGITHQQAFGGTSASISGLQLVPWGGDPQRLASLVAQRALHGARPGLFISYRRLDSAAVADQLFDEMSHRGFRVFLDRFSVTTGRLVQQEIAEELADRDVVLVLETDNILQSRWTSWEIAFARTYRLGLLALQWPGAPTLRGISDRRSINPGRGGILTANELRSAADFIERGHTLASLTRRAFYEALVEAAALSKQGSVHPTGTGALRLLDRGGTERALVAPSGRPGSLAEVHRLVRAALQPPNGPLLLAGQHRHLPPDAHDDLNWLAQTVGVDLAGRADVYRQVRTLL
jgi:hypothetical protein